MHLKKAFPVALMMVLGACGTPASPSGSPDLSRIPADTYRLALGEEVVVQGIVTLGFYGVDEDSRCPADVVCIQAGNAAITVGIAIGKGPTVPIQLNTGREPRSGTAGVTVELIQLTPTPISTQATDPSAYRADLRLSPP